ncbi:hypothetical protein J6S88_07755 [bacterium]|nr:hypothetical protein [bacterium]
MDDVEKIIEETVNRTVTKLKVAGLMKDDRKTAFQKTEELLLNYNNLKLSDERKTKILVAKMNEALGTIKTDIYYGIIPMFYFEHETRENIADYYNTTVTTISRNKTRLVNELKAILFSSDFITEIYS